MGAARRRLVRSDQICLNANLTRQFEFVQHTWLNNPNFNGLYDDADPLVGARRPDGTTFTQPARPVRRRFLGVPEFVTVRAGGDFFLTSQPSPPRSSTRCPASYGRTTGRVPRNAPVTPRPMGWSAASSPSAMTCRRHCDTGCSGSPPATRRGYGSPDPAHCPHPVSYTHL